MALFLIHLEEINEGVNVDFLFQAFIGTIVVTVSFLMLSIASAGKEPFNCNYKSEMVFQDIQDEEIEEVTYEELDEKISVESLKQRENQINTRYSEIS